MKHVKFSIAVLIIVLFLAVLLTACELGGSATVNSVTLNTPVNVRVVGDYIYWDAVPNAQSYFVTINGYPQNSVSDPLFYIPAATGIVLIDEEATELTVKVVAKGNSITYSDSSASQPCTASYTKRASSSSEYERTEDGNIKLYENVSVFSTRNPDYADDYISYKDSNFWYYFFDLGTLHNVQLQAGEFQPYQGVETVLEFNTINTTSEQIQESCEKATSKSTSVSTTSSWSFGATFNLGRIVEKLARASLSLNYSHSTTNTDSFTESEISSTMHAAEQANQNARTVQYKITSNSKEGMYTYMLWGEVEVYEVVVYDIAEQKYYTDEISIVKSSNYALVYLGGMQATYKNYADVKLEFDNAIIETLSEPTETKMQIESAPIAVKMKRYSCIDNTGYDKTKPDTDSMQAQHKGFEIGELILEGCSMFGDDYYLADKDLFSLNYHILYDLGNLPIDGGKTDFRGKFIRSDSATFVTGTDIANQTVGYGAYWVQVNYTDNSSVQYTTTNGIRKANSSANIVMLSKSDIDTKKVVKSIDVVVAYEMELLDFPSQRVTNWRCEYTFEFTQSSNTNAEVEEVYTYDEIVTAMSEQGYLRTQNSVYLGMYPQTVVSDTTLISALTAETGALPTTNNGGEWVSYEYYIQNKNTTQFMWYKDVEYEGNKYRGVYFTKYRPIQTCTDKSNADNSYQDNNGYSINTLYWFRFEPIKWTILEEEDGELFLLSDIALDARQYHWTESDHDGVKGNNYEKSDIRNWLNGVFYDTAFDDLQKELILLSNTDNSARSTNPDGNPYYNNGNGNNSYAGSNTQDKVFLASVQEVSKQEYGFEQDMINTGTRCKIASDYAQCQGLKVMKNDQNEPVVYWYLRSPHWGYSTNARIVSEEGSIQRANVRDVYEGLVPAIRISLGD